MARLDPHRGPRRLRRLPGEAGVAQYRVTPGNEGTHLMLGKLDGGRTQIVARSFWTSYDAIHGFAGEDIETAGYYPEDGRYLVQREDTAEASRPR